jgi:hypothetical protein
LARVGFCCKWIDGPEQINGFKPDDAARELNTRVTTVAWLNRQTRDVAEERLWDLMRHNIESIRKLVERVGTLDDDRRMVRLAVIYCLFILSLVGVISGSEAMYEHTLRKHSEKLAGWAAVLMFGCLFILASLLSWLAIRLVLWSVA